MSPAVILFLLFIFVPLAEIGVFIRVGGAIGLFPTLALCVLTAIVGTLCIRFQGFKLVNQARAQLEAGEAPVFEVVSGACLVVAGLMLLTPGFVTDAVGFLLLLPPARRLIFDRFVAKRMATVAGAQAGGRPGSKQPGRRAAGSRTTGSARGRVRGGRRGQGRDAAATRWLGQAIMILVRHGEGHWNTHFHDSRVDVAIADPGLTEIGRQQAVTAADRLRDHDVRRLVTSPYRRTLETALIIAERLGLDITVDPLVRERCAFACDQGTPASLLAQHLAGHRLHRARRALVGSADREPGVDSRPGRSVCRRNGARRRLAARGRGVALGFHPRLDRQDRRQCRAGPLEHRESRIARGVASSPSSLRIR